MNERIGFTLKEIVTGIDRMNGRDIIRYEVWERYYKMTRFWKIREERKLGGFDTHAEAENFIIQQAKVGYIKHARDYTKNGKPIYYGW